jgi:TPR repeat protein
MLAGVVLEGMEFVMAWRRFVPLLAFFVVGAAYSPPAAAQSEMANVLTAACNRGDMLSCANLGILYRHGRGATKDYARALTLFVKACEGGKEFACGYAGEMTYDGLGIKPNKKHGEKLMRRACRRGDNWSCHAMRRHGLAVPAT